MRYPITVHFDEADPRGILFFGRILPVAHRVFEDFVVPALVARWEDWFLSDEFLVPIRHAEASFTGPMRPGGRYEAEVEIATIGATSFEVRTRFFDVGGREERLCAETRVTQVFADPATFTKQPIPREIRTRLEGLRDQAAQQPATAAGTSPGPSAESRGRSPRVVPVRTEVWPPRRTG